MFKITTYKHLNLKVLSVLIVLSFSGGVFAKSIEFNGKTYKTITSLETGRVWLDRNLGASRPCQSSADLHCYGDLYQWGRGNDGHQFRISGTTKVVSDVFSPAHSQFILNQLELGDWLGERWDWEDENNTDIHWGGKKIRVDDGNANGWRRSLAWKDGGAHDICPKGFSVPTNAELRADTIKASVGMALLKLPVAGFRFFDSGGVVGVGENGAVWSRTTVGEYGRLLEFKSNSAYFNSSKRAYGASVRCIED